MFSRTVVRTLRPLRCQAARYTTINAPTPPPPTPEAPKSGTNAAVYIAAAAGLGGAAYYFLSGSPSGKSVEPSTVISAPGAPTFTGGSQGFIPLKVLSVEDISPNTKKLRFQLPEDNSVSGLTVASALLTKFKAEGAEKPVIRPYTPTSDESKLLSIPL